MNTKQKILLLTYAKFSYMQNLRICKSLPCVQGLIGKHLTRFIEFGQQLVLLCFLIKACVLYSLSGVKTAHISKVLSSILIKVYQHS